MSQISILNKGNIYFFYRPNIEHAEAHQLEDIQRFFMVLKPEKSDRYILIIIGKKHLPKEGEEKSNFAFIEKIFKKTEDLSAAFKAQEYSTSARGKRKLAPARAVGEGQFALVHHEQHSHLIYQLRTPEKVGHVQEDFRLSAKGDYIISVKNPEQPSPSYAGLSPKEKAHYPKKLQERFGDKKFIPLNSEDFLNYEGAEFILTSKARPNLTKKEVSLQNGLNEIPEEEIATHFKSLKNPESLAPLLQKKWT
jgi:hypothetical protein